MATTKSHISILASFILVIMISGCTGKSLPTRYYTLTSTTDTQNLMQENNRTKNLSIGIGPVKIADYLNQSRIVTRSDVNKIDRAEFDQWSGSLQNNIVNTLADNIGHFTDTEKVFLHPWRSFVPIDYQVIIEIVRFDGYLGDAVTLEARWYVMKDKSITNVKRSTISEAVDGPDFMALVAAESKALEKLSLEIAQSILKASSK